MLGYKEFVLFFFRPMGELVIKVADCLYTKFLGISESQTLLVLNLVIFSSYLGQASGLSYNETNFREQRYV